MRWLLDSSVTDAVGQALERHGHKIFRPEAAVPDKLALLAAAEKQQLDVITAEKLTADALFEAEQPAATGAAIKPFRFHRSIVFLQLPGADVEQDDAIDRLFKRYKRLTPGRLYTITETRVKVRQLPTGPAGRGAGGKSGGTATTADDSVADDDQDDE